LDKNSVSPCPNNNCFLSDNASLNKNDLSGLKATLTMCLITPVSRMVKCSPGEVCFPGARSEPNDRDEIAVALREGEEEMGLHAEQSYIGLCQEQMKHTGPVRTCY
uniref:Nudix hydrolase domain-containing protein n=1 Tax=Salvator merianae TaxID=96440 RepID=A0A8D0KJY3_SALMN